MAESRIVKARLDDEYQNKLRQILLKYDIAPEELGADSIGIRISIDLAIEQLRYLPKDAVQYYYKTVSQAYHLRKKKHKRKPKSSVYSKDPKEKLEDDWGIVPQK